jgi:lysophospholipase L1-like esterase
VFEMIFKDLDRIVFAGDSVTDMGSDHPVGEGLFDSLGKGYVRIIDNMLAAWYPEIRVRVTNSGISGNTSRDLLERYERDVESLNPDWVSICIGINDVWRQFDSPAMPECGCLLDEYERNVEEMIVRVKDKVKGVFLLTPYYVEPNTEDMMRARIDEYVEICKSLRINITAFFLISRKCSRIIAKSVIHPSLPGTEFTPIRLVPLSWQESFSSIAILNINAYQIY